MSKVEEVAAAIADAAGSDFTKLQVNGPGFGLRKMYMNMARAAIEALREPTGQMEYMIDRWFDLPPNCGEGKKRWHSLIDAALKDNPHGQ